MIEEDAGCGSTVVDKPAEWHPAGKGLDDSGYVVSVLRSAAVIDMYVDENGFVCISVPGNPCKVLLGCSERGAEALVATLTEGLERLRVAREQQT